MATTISVFIASWLLGVQVAASWEKVQYQGPQDSVSMHHGWPRRLQPHSGCQWNGASCALKESYVKTEADKVPQISKFKSVIDASKSCLVITEKVRCLAGACLWLAQDSVCSPRVETIQFRAMVAAAFPPASCGQPGAEGKKVLDCMGKDNSTCTADADCTFKSEMTGGVAGLALGAACTRVAQQRCDVANPQNPILAGTPAGCGDVISLMEKNGLCSVKTSEASCTGACTWAVRAYCQITQAKEESYCTLKGTELSKPTSLDINPNKEEAMTFLQTVSGALYACAGAKDEQTCDPAGMASSSTASILAWGVALMVALAVSFNLYK